MTSPDTGAPTRPATRPTTSPGTSIDLPEQLRDEIRMLGRLLGEVIAEEAGEDVYVTVETLRRAAVAHRRDDADRGSIDALIASLDTSTAEQVTRAFTIFFQLTNLAEQRATIRDLAVRDDGTAPVPDSVAAAVAAVGADRLAGMLGDTRIHPVWTAHPTEARRRAVVDALRRIDDQLARADAAVRGAAEDASIRRHLLEEIAILWRTAQIRTSRPTPVDEVRKLMAVFDATVFRIVPHFYREVDTALHGEAAGAVDPGVPSFVTFGSWVGGDRDGNPRVTSTVTAETAALMSDRVLRGLENACRRIARTLSATDDVTPATAELHERLEELEGRFPVVAEAQAKRAARSPHRRLLAICAERLAGRPGGAKREPGPRVAHLVENPGQRRQVGAQFGHGFLTPGADLFENAQHLHVD